MMVRHRIMVKKWFRPFYYPSWNPYYDNFHLDSENLTNPVLTKMFRSHNRLIKKFLGNINKLFSHGWTEAYCERNGLEPSIFPAEIHGTAIFTLVVKISLSPCWPNLSADLSKNCYETFDKLSNHRWTKSDCERKGADHSMFPAEIHVTAISHRWW